MGMGFKASKPNLSVPSTYNTSGSSKATFQFDKPTGNEYIEAPLDYTNPSPKSPEAEFEDVATDNKKVLVDFNKQKIKDAVAAVTGATFATDYVVKIKLEDLSKGLVATASQEHNIQTHRREYEWFYSMEWCAQYATWVYENTYIDGKSAAEIAGLTYDRSAGEDWTASTGRLMMHFYTADNPDLGFDYTSEPYYKGKNSNIGFFYNDYSSLYEGKNAELGKVSSGNKYIPKPGDFVFFNHYGSEYDKNSAWNPNKTGLESVQDHTGMVLEIKTDANGNLIELTTLEGNIGDSHYSRTIKFDGTDPYSEYVIGYGTINNLK